MVSCVLMTSYVRSPTNVFYSKKRRSRIDTRRKTPSGVGIRQALDKQRSEMLNNMGR
jgi:hypothetical protein